MLQLDDCNSYKHYDYIEQLTIKSSRFLSAAESTITHRNQERIISLFKCKSTSRSKGYLNPLYRHLEEAVVILLTRAQCYTTHFLSQNRKCVA